MLDKRDEEIERQYALSFSERDKKRIAQYEKRAKQEQDFNLDKVYDV